MFSSHQSLFDICFFYHCEPFQHDVIMSYRLGGLERETCVDSMRVRLVLIP
jgi:hypothetical protein